MNDIITQLKCGLAVQLQKEGSSLEELELLLAQPASNEKKAQLLEKMAFFGEKTLGSIGSGAVDLTGSILKALPEWGMTTALMAGSLGGAGLYGLKGHLSAQDKKHKEKDDEVERIKVLTERIKQDYGIQ